MSLFESLAGSALNTLNSSNNAAAPNLMEIASQLIGPEVGGLPALISLFQEKGLGDVIASWIGTGQNLPITGEQLLSILGNERVQGIAQQIGMNPADAANTLAQLLPQAINMLTPNRVAPEGNLVEQGLALFMSMSGKAR